MVITPFNFTRTPKILFGAGRFSEVGKIAGEIGETVLIVTGSRSLKSSEKWDELVKSLQTASLRHFEISATGEPSPEFVDSAVTKFKDRGIDVVLAVGGGSVLDAGKAISAMLLQDKSVVNFLEGVGTGEAHSGVKIPFVAIPTTSGTGSEVTKNAVLSKTGPDGYKKSLRHDNFVPDVALIDPELMVSCSNEITASTGIDACTQLLEAYVSTKATPLTDAIAISGLEQIRINLVLACTTGADDVNVRAGMAYAAFASGIVLANAGLGIVHGLASPLGGHFPIPHGVACGTLVSSATKENIDTMRESNLDNPTLSKYAHAGWLLSKKHSNNIYEGCDILIEQLDEWTEKLNLPLLTEYGISVSDLDQIIEETGQKNNPVNLSYERIKNILSRRM